MRYTAVYLRRYRRGGSMDMVGTLVEAGTCYVVDAVE